MVIIMDDEDRENEGDLIMAAELATPEAVAFMIRHTSGIICVPMEEERLLGWICRRWSRPTTITPYGLHRLGGFAARHHDRRFRGDRAATIRRWPMPHHKPPISHVPGISFPLRPRRGGVLVRPGHTEAAVDLCRLAGMKPAGVSVRGHER